jgi:hypothetical protein
MPYDEAYAHLCWGLSLEPSSAKRDEHLTAAAEQFEALACEYELGSSRGGRR